MKNFINFTSFVFLGISALWSDLTIQNQTLSGTETYSEDGDVLVNNVITTNSADVKVFASGEVVLDGESTLEGEVVLEAVDFGLSSNKVLLNADGSKTSIQELSSTIPLEDNKSSLRGSFKAVNNGSASYDVNFPIPSGTGGLRSPLGINYNSVREDGKVGVGFQLHGIDSISVTGKDIRKDGEFGAVDLIPPPIDLYVIQNYNFMYQGQRLIQRAVSGQKVYYNPENSPLIQIVFDATNKEFVVKDGAGQIRTYSQQQEVYGVNNTGQVYTIAWWLTKVEDKFGNNYTISYSNDTTTEGLYPVSIEHDSRDNTDGFSLDIQLSYKSRNSYPTAFGEPKLYINAKNNFVYLPQNKLLEKVTVNKNNKVLSEFSLNYKQSPDSKRPLLEKISTKQYDKYGFAIELDDLNFVWSDERIFPTFPSSKPTGHFNVAHEDSHVMFQGDFDGDGKLEFVHLELDDDTNSTLFPLNWSMPKYITSSKLFVNNLTGTINSSDISETNPDRQIHNQNHNDVSRQFLVGDVNGNGKHELIYIEEDFETPSSDGFLKAYVFSFDGTNFVYQYNNQKVTTRKSIAQLVDMNLDGKADLVRTTLDNHSYIVHSCSELHQVPNGHIWGGTATFSDIHDLNLTNAAKSAFWTFLDMNQDGYLEQVLIAEESNNGQYELNLRYCNSYFASSVATAYEHKRFPAYKNISEKVTLKTYSSPLFNTNSGPSISEKVLMGDLNGDLITEILHFKEDANGDSVDIFHINQHASISELDVALPISTTSNEEIKWVLGNFNGDSTTDIIRWEQTENNGIIQNELKTYSLFNGDFFLSKTTNLDSGDEMMLHIGNYDSDRDQEIVYFLNDAEGENRVLMHQNNHDQHPADVVTAIEEGDEISTYIFYNGEYSFDMADPSYPNMKTNMPFRLVDSFRVQNADLSSTTYIDYYNPLTNLDGEGFLGFGKRSIYNVEKGVRAEEIYYQEYPYIGFMKESYSYTDIGLQERLVNHTENSFETLTLSHTNAYGYAMSIPYLKSTVSKTYDPYISIPNSVDESLIYQVETTNVMDNDGQITQVNVVNTQFTKVDVSDAPYSQRKIETESINVFDENPSITSSTWVVSRLNEVKVKTWDHDKTYDFDNVYRRSVFTYDATTGVLLTEQVVGETTKTYGRDIYGQITDVTITGSDIDTRYSESTLDCRGKVLSSRVYLGYDTVDETYHEVTTEYDEWSDVVLSQTDANGLVTKYYYDRLNRNIATVAPDNTYVMSFSIEYDDQTVDGLKPDWGVVRQKLVSKSSGSPHESYQYVDVNGKVLRTVTVAKNGQYVYQDNKFNSLGLLTEKTNAYYSNTTPDWHENTYDDMERLKRVDFIDGSYQQVTYKGHWTITTRHAANEKVRARKVYKNLDRSVVKSIDYDIDEIGEDCYVLNEYEPRGKLVKTYLQNKTANESDILLHSNTYDSLGRLVTSDSNSSGQEQITYYTTGEVKTVKDALNNVVTTTYDELGRTTSVTNTTGVTHYVYDTKRIGAVSTISESYSGHSIEYFYDSLGRVVQTNQVIDGQSYSESLSYDELGRESERTYPDGFGVSKTYTTDNYLQEVKNASTGQVYWTHGTENESGQILTSTLGNGVLLSNTYDSETGVLTNQTASKNNNNLMAYNYTWNSFGELTQREDTVSGVGSLSETFMYDHMGRITYNSRPNGEFSEMTYNRYGNIKSRHDYFSIYNESKVHDYIYNNNASVEPFAVQYIKINGVSVANYQYDGKGQMTSAYSATLPDANFKYNSFGKVYDINNGESKYKYGIGGEKIQRISNNTHTFTTVSSLYEVENENSTEKRHRKIEAFGSVIAISTIEGSTETLTYQLKDHLGSPVATLDENGLVQERFSYDMWGGYRDPTTWSLIPATNTDPQVLTGFTGHEREVASGFIHMDGRVYDPVLARFTSPDPFVKDATNTQDHNRYTYTRNSPVNYTDPSGYLFDGIFDDMLKNPLHVGHTQLMDPIIYNNYKEEIHEFDARYGSQIKAIAVTAVLSYFLGPAGAQLSPVVVGAVAGAASGYVASNGDWKATRNGAIFGAVFGAIGDMGLSGGAQYTAHGLVGGVQAEVNGGEFWQGFASGFVTAYSGARTEGFVNSTNNSLFNGSTVSYYSLQVTTAAVIGGTTSVITGGKFSNGAMTGAFSRAFNDLLHGDYTVPEWDAPLTEEQMDQYLGAWGEWGAHPTFDTRGLSEIKPSWIDFTPLKFLRGFRIFSKAPNTPKLGSLSNKIKDFKANPKNWQRTSASASQSTKKGAKGGVSIESTYKNVKTGETINVHDVFRPSGQQIPKHPTFRDYGKN